MPQSRTVQASRLHPMLESEAQAIARRLNLARRAGALAHPTAHLVNFKASLARQRFAAGRPTTRSGSDS